MNNIQNLTGEILFFQGIAIGPYQTQGYSNIFNYKELSELLVTNRARVFVTSETGAIDKEIELTSKLNEILEEEFNVSGGNDFDESLKELSNNITSFNYDSTFNLITSIKKLSIPRGCTIILNTSLGSCTSLTTLNIPSTVTSIESTAFEDCSSLETIYIDNIEDSISGAPWGATNAEIIWTKDNPNSNKIELRNISDSTKTYYSSYEEAASYLKENPSSTFDMTVGRDFEITTVPNKAFYEVTNINNVVIKNNTTDFDSMSFASCSLTSITFPQTLQTLGNGCFQNSTNLNMVVLPDSTRTVGNGCFSGCSSLTSLTLNEGLTTLGSGAVQSTGHFTALVVPGTLTTIIAMALGNLTCDEITLSEGVTTLNAGSLSGTKFDKLNIPSTVTSIEMGALSGVSPVTPNIAPDVYINKTENSIPGNPWGSSHQLNVHWIG